MAIYEPASRGAGIFSGQSIGKEVPSMGPFKSFRPKLVGPGSGKVKAAIRGMYYVGRYFRKNPRFGARIGAVATGAAVRYGTNATNNQYRKAYGTAKSGRGGFRSNNSYNNRVQCCCTSCNCH